MAFSSLVSVEIRNDDIVVRTASILKTKENGVVPVEERIEVR